MITQACSSNSQRTPAKGGKKKHPLSGSPFQFGLCVVREIALGSQQDRLHNASNFFDAIDPIAVDFLLALIHRWAKFADLVLKFWSAPEPVLERLDFALE